MLQTRLLIGHPDRKSSNVPNFNKNEDFAGSFTKDDFVASLRKELWLPLLAVEHHDVLVLHLPLVYASQCDGILKSYLNAADSFLRLGLKKRGSYTKIVDDLVLHFSPTVLDAAIDRRLARTSVSEPLVTEILRLVRMARQLPEIVLEMELRLDDDEADWRKLEKASLSCLSHAIEANLYNPFISFEVEFAFIKFAQNRSAKKIQSPSEFNHLKLYLDAQKELISASSDRKLNQEVFFEHFSFLASEKSAVQHEAVRFNFGGLPRIEELSSEFNVVQKILQMVRISYQELNFENYFNMPFNLFDLLAYHEEWRHYWQARLERAILIRNWHFDHLRS